MQVQSLMRITTSGEQVPCSPDKPQQSISDPFRAETEVGSPSCEYHCFARWIDLCDYAATCSGEIPAMKLIRARPAALRALAIRTPGSFGSRGSRSQGLHKRSTGYESQGDRLVDVMGICVQPLERVFLTKFHSQRPAQTVGWGSFPLMG